jgi:hypothetical protein
MLAPDALVLHVSVDRILWSSACADLCLGENALVGSLGAFFPVATLVEVTSVGMFTHQRASASRAARRFSWSLYAGGILAGRNLTLADERESRSAEAARYARVLAQSRDKLTSSTLPSNTVIPVCAMAHLLRLGGSAGAQDAQQVLTALEAGSRDLHISQTLCTLQRLVDDVSGWVLASAAADDDVRFVVECGSPDVLAREHVMDYRKLHTVLTNLLENSLVYTVSGRVTLLIEQTGVSPSHTAVRISVRDTGVGMSDESLREFRDTSRARSFTAFDAGGMGVGLPTARKLVRAMGGELRAERLAGETGGSLVYFDVSLARLRVRRGAAGRQASFEMPPHIAAASPDALRACRVLLVHPDEAPAGDLRTSLLTMGLRDVEVVPNCRDCLLRLSDAELPRVSVLLVDERVEYGATALLELASRLRLDGDAPRAHVIRARDDLRTVAAVFTEYASE